MDQRRRAAIVVSNLLLLPFCFWGMQGGDTDTFYHLAGGRWMLEHRHVLDHEAFSFTIPGRPWANYYWLFECLIYAAYAAAGRAGLLLLRGALILSTGNLLFFWTLRRTGGRLLETMGFALMAAALYLPRAVNLRPHLFSYLFLVLLLLGLERFRGSRAFVDWALVALCVVWANVHGVEYPIVLAVIALYAASALWPYRKLALPALLRQRAAARWLALFAACTGAFLVNPFGWRLLPTSGISFDAEVMAQIGEMGRISWESFADLTPYPVFNSLTPFRYAFVAGALLLVYWVRRRELLPAAFFVLGAGLAFTKARFLPEFALLFIPFAAEGVMRLRERGAGWARTLGTIVAAFAVYQGAALAWVAHNSLRDGSGAWVDAGQVPVGPVAFLRQQGLSGNVCLEPGAAGYVTWELYPAIRVFMDMRTPEPFDAGLLWLIQAIHGPVSITAVDARWSVDFLILHRTDGLFRRLLAEPEGRYAAVYADGEWVLLAHERQLVGERAALRLQALGALEALEGGRGVSDADGAAALRDAERLIAITPDNVLAQHARIALWLADGKADAARDTARALAQQHRREARYAVDYGVALLALGQPDAGAAAIADAIARAPERVPSAAYSLLAETYLRLGRSRQGLNVMEAYRERQRFRLSGSEHALLGKLRQRCGELMPAVDAYERALWLVPEADPLRSAVENDLAAAYLDLQQPQRALELAEAALRRPDAPPTAALIRERAVKAMEKRE
jgi:tetratricopeptide (TPR) repeat protein